ncbi:ABC transporter permease [Novosphingobium resinovorum]|uniref:ABC transporter permease n=1 Tax=Novosphingobium resinovorum TaxID=158500 RepID=UPI002ED47FF4|nr:ABC transporter permease [Novosphingobium resinovorum]
MSLFNARSAWTIYKQELMRAFRTAMQSILAPVLTTTLYFVVFGAAIGGQMSAGGHGGLNGVNYGAFIVPGLLLLTILGESVSNASFGIYMPRFTGAIYELLSAPVGVIETLLGFVGAAATKSLILAAIILATASFFVDYSIAHPVYAFFYVLLVSASFSLFGFILGIWADSFEKLTIVPLLILTPLTFLGGTFYSIDMLPDPWRQVAMANPVVYLVNGLRWTFYGSSDVPIGLSLGLTFAFLAVCVGIITWIFRSGWRLRT